MRHKWFYNRESRHLRLLCLSLQLLTILSLAACGTRPPDWNEILKNRPRDENPQPRSAATTNELVVYLDTSASMAGYVTSDGQSIFGKTLRELRYATGTFDNSNVKVSVRRIASDVGPVLTDMELTNASQDQGVYRGGETNLAGAISAFKAPPAPATTEKQNASVAAKAENPAAEAVPKFHILV